MSAWKASVRCLELDAHLTLAPRTFEISFCCTCMLQMAPTGAVDSFDLMLCEKLCMEQGQRQSYTVAW